MKIILKQNSRKIGEFSNFPDCQDEIYRKIDKMYGAGYSETVIQVLTSSPTLNGVTTDNFSFTKRVEEKFEDLPVKFSLAECPLLAATQSGLSGLDNV